MDTNCLLKQKEKAEQDIFYFYENSLTAWDVSHHSIPEIINQKKYKTGASPLLILRVLRMYC
jgi:hypothetical protein